MRKLLLALVFICGLAQAQSMIAFVPDTIYLGETSWVGWSCPAQFSDHAWLTYNNGSPMTVEVEGMQGPFGGSSIFATIYCFNNLGEYVYDTAYLTVYPGYYPTVVSFTALPTNIYRGQNSTLSFVCGGLSDHASISGSYYFDLPYGSQVVSPIVTTQYTLKCADNYGGEAFGYVTVTIDATGAKLIVIIGGG